MTKIPTRNYVNHFDPAKAHHRAWLQAVLDRLEELDPKALQDGGELRDLWKAAVETKAPLADPAWLAPALKIIREFEGCRLDAYLCPAGVWTIGWGSTRMPSGGAVRKGDRITQAQADAMLDREVRELFGPGTASLFTHWARLAPNAQAALISWAYNVGLAAVEDSALRRRLNAGEDPNRVAREELPRWDKVDGKPLAGLARRRAAEVELFTGGATPRPMATLRPCLRLTRTRKLDARGLELLRLQYLPGGSAAGEILCVSGAPGAQQFRTGKASRAGSLEPLPEGLYRIEDIAWAGGKDNYSASWGAGLGPVSIPLAYRAPGTTARSAIEIHIDWNARVAPGTAGCIGIATEADMRKLVGWLRETDPRELYVDWGLGTVPTRV